MLLFTLAVILPLCIRAQSSSPEEDAAALYNEVDVDSDGEVSLQEVIIYFNRMDNDHDGRVSRQEFHEYWFHRYPSLPSPGIHAIFDILDVDVNHHLELDDFSLFYHVMDPDDDDVVTRAEFMNYWIPKFQQHIHG